VRIGVPQQRRFSTQDDCKHGIVGELGMVLFMYLDGLPCRIVGTGSADLVGILVAPIRDENKNGL